MKDSAIFCSIDALSAQHGIALLLHMGIAVVSVTILICLFLGWRESLVVAIATLFATVWLYVRIPKGLLPLQDTGLIIGVTDTAQTISFKAMAQRQREIAEIVRRDPDVVNVASFVGAGTVNATVNTGRLYINLKPVKQRSRTQKEVEQDIRDRLRDIPGIDLSVGFNRPINVAVLGPDPVVLDQITSQLADKIRKVKGVADLESSVKPGVPAFAVRIRPDALKELGLKQPPSLVWLTGDSPGAAKEAEYFQNLLQSRLGITLKIDKQIFKQRLAKMTAGDFDIVVFPGLMIILHLRPGSPPAEGPTEGSVINHVGLIVQNVQEAVARWKAAGVPVVPGNNNRLDQAYVNMPDGLRIEVLEDKAQKEPVRHEHVHFFLPEAVIAQSQAWYAKHFGAKPGVRNDAPVADLPGVQLRFAKVDKPMVPTRGRILDHIGFDCKIASPRRDLDREDRACMGHALELGRDGGNVRWDNPRLGITYVLTPTGAYRHDSMPCRNFRIAEYRNGRRKVATGHACRVTEGEWRLVRD